MQLLVNNVKGKISVIKTSGGLRQSLGDYRKYLLTFRSCSKIFGRLGGTLHSSEVIGQCLSSLTNQNSVILPSMLLRSRTVIPLVIAAVREKWIQESG